MFESEVGTQCLLSKNNFSQKGRRHGGELRCVFFIRERGRFFVCFFVCCVWAFFGLLCVVFFVCCVCVFLSCVVRGRVFSYCAWPCFLLLCVGVLFLCVCVWDVLFLCVCVGRFGSYVCGAFFVCVGAGAFIFLSECGAFFVGVVSGCFFVRGERFFFVLVGVIFLAWERVFSLRGGVCCPCGRGTFLPLKEGDIFPLVGRKCVFPPCGKAACFHCAAEGEGEERRVFPMWEEGGACFSFVGGERASSSLVGGGRVSP